MDTNNIKEALENVEHFDDSMITDNPPQKLNELLNAYIQQNGTTKAEVIRRLNIDRNYAYQVFNGKRVPTRNMLLQMSLILELDAEQTDYLLKLAGKPALYVRNIVDARVFYAIKHHMKYEDALMFVWNGTVHN